MPIEKAKGAYYFFFIASANNAPIDPIGELVGLLPWPLRWPPLDLRWGERALPGDFLPLRESLSPGTSSRRMDMPMRLRGTSTSITFT